MLVNAHVVKSNSMEMAAMSRLQSQFAPNNSNTYYSLFQITFIINSLPTKYFNKLGGFFIFI